MAEPARKLPTDQDSDSTAILAAIRDLGERMERRFEKVDDRLRKVETDVAELKGRVSQLPTTVQMIGFVLAVLLFSGIMKFLM